MSITDNQIMSGLVGERDAHIRAIEKNLSVSVHVRGNEIFVEGKNTDAAVRVIEELVLVLERGGTLEEGTVARSIHMVQGSVSPAKVLTDRILTTARNRPVVPKTQGQKAYVDAIRKNMVTFGFGPAGTGKSWLAVACAVRALQNKEVERILLTRPAVEAGERLGYLPGDLLSKVDPYLRPLYDALSDMLGVEHMAKFLESNVIEVAPLAFMRGRTLNDSFIILDEAQNTTSQQMMMFLTRIGFNSQAVVTGDLTQTDLAAGRSGLVGLEKVLGGVEGLGFVRLSSKDIVRHRIVQDIVDAYAKYQGK